ncbi:hypothetical protein OPV22_009777 [Ensete ventricosum]|uniref:Uncharacterized protein n=1 Tax=Ensete ventricosum TaxID=4639 RepID=A0AAV8PSE8_ENSVE|nr:hypothetical protein OPV22_009777 [Ensete ventricosum]
MTVMVVSHQHHQAPSSLFLSPGGIRHRHSDSNHRVTGTRNVCSQGRVMEWLCRYVSRIPETGNRVSKETLPLASFGTSNPSLECLRSSQSMVVMEELLDKQK